MTEDAVRIVQVDRVDDPNGRTPPPIWIVVVVLLAVVTGLWLLVSQGPTESDVVTNSTPRLATTDDASAITPTVTTDDASVITPTATSATVADPVSVFGNPPIAITAETPQQLRGYVAVTSPDDPPFFQDTVWVFRPGGSVVSRANTVIGRFTDEYPMLITAGRLVLAGRILDIDLAEPGISLWTSGSVIPGSGPGVVWLARRIERITSDSLWVSPVDVESLTVGERIDVTDLFSRSIVGVADGLIVEPVEEDVYGMFAYWSPTDGLVPLSIRNPAYLHKVVAASGELVVVAQSGSVSVIDIASGEYVVSFALDFAGPVTSACLSPDGQHVIVVGWNGEALVANTTTGATIELLEGPSEYDRGSPIRYPLSSVQRKYGIGWTTNDQLVLIAESGDAKHILGINVATGEYFHVATLNGPGWRLAASGTMC